MLSRSDKQKIQSLTIKSLMSQLPGRYVSTVFVYLNTSLRCVRLVLSRLQWCSLHGQQFKMTTSTTNEGFTDCISDILSDLLY